jgi:hypothetical protein
LTDIETNGDSIKLWLTENCIFEEGAFESTAVLYHDYRLWCDENGVTTAGRPKMRDVITTYRPSVTANRQRVVDSETGEIKLVWGLIGIRLRRPEDDLPDPDLVDPPLPDTGSPRNPQYDGRCDGDPVDSPKLSQKGKREASQIESPVESFSQDDRITGSDTPAKPHEEPIKPHDPAPDPVPTQGQQAMFHNLEEVSDKESDVLRYFPYLACYSKNTHKAKG